MAEYKPRKRGYFYDASVDNEGGNIALFALIALKINAEKQ
jgi:hypothetical protein